MLVGVFLHRDTLLNRRFAAFIWPWSQGQRRCCVRSRCGGAAVDKRGVCAIGCVVLNGQQREVAGLAEGQIAAAKTSEHEELDLNIALVARLLEAETDEFSLLEVTCLRCRQPLLVQAIQLVRDV